MLEKAHGVVGTKTGQLACSYFDLFCCKWAGVNSIEVAYVVAATCLLVSSKFNETSPLTPDWVSSLSNGVAPAAAIIKLELMILINLNWNLEQATASEISRVLLTMWAPGHDLEELLRDSDGIANVCYPVATLMSHGPTQIALASICCVFDQRKLSSYRDAWLSQVLPKTSASREDVLRLSLSIRTHLVEAYGSDADTECESPGLERSLSV